jgi:hypothetical protein
VQRIPARWPLLMNIPRHAVMWEILRWIIRSDRGSLPSRERVNGRKPTIGPLSSLVHVASAQYWVTAAVHSIPIRDTVDPRGGLLM